MSRLLDELFARADEEVLVWDGGEPWVHMRAVCRTLGLNWVSNWEVLQGRKGLRFRDQPMQFKKMLLLSPDGRRRVKTVMHGRDFLYWMLVYEPKPGKGAAHLKPLIDEFRREAMDMLWRGGFLAAFRAIPLDGPPRFVEPTP